MAAKLLYVERTLWRCFFHCAAHSANLASEHTVTAESSPLLRDALQNVNELGLL